MRTGSVLLTITLLSSLLSCECVINRFSFFPDTRFKVAADRLPRTASEVRITTPDGLKIQALYFSKNKNSGKLIIYFHGNAGNLYHRIDEALKLQESGWNILLVSYRGYAQSEGSPTEKGIYTDGESALRFATDVLGYSPENICLYGRSLGTTVAVHTAQHKNLSRVILITPISSGREMARLYTGDTLSSIADGTFNSIVKIRNISVPVLILHGTDDEIVPYIQGQQLYSGINGRKKMVTIPGGSHNDLEYTHPAVYWNSVYDFLNEDFR